MSLLTIVLTTAGLAVSHRMSEREREGGGEGGRERGRERGGRKGGGGEGGREWGDKEMGILKSLSFLTSLVATLSPRLKLVLFYRRRYTRQVTTT